jgi:Domain of unknown function (DUF4326)
MKNSNPNVQPNSESLPIGNNMLAEGNLVRPVRVQRKRTKGWKMPENTVYVGRPTKLGNSYIVGNPTYTGKDIDGYVESVEMAVNLYERQYNFMCEFNQDFKNELINYLRGKNLACWCPLDKPCHADVLLKIVNGE